MTVTLQLHGRYMTVTQEGLRLEWRTQQREQRRRVASLEMELHRAHSQYDELRLKLQAAEGRAREAEAAAAETHARLGSVVQAQGSVAEQAAAEAMDRTIAATSAEMAEVTPLQPLQPLRPLRPLRP